MRARFMLYRTRVNLSRKCNLSIWFTAQRILYSNIQTIVKPISERILKSNFEYKNI